jgi:branched-chain amino acid transport system permease protein
MQAVRDRDQAAEAIGVHLARYKVLAFVLSSSLGAAPPGPCTGPTSASSPRRVLLFAVDHLHRHHRGRRRRHRLRVGLGAVFITTVPRLIEEISPSLPSSPLDTTAGAS